MIKTRTRQVCLFLGAVAAVAMSTFFSQRIWWENGLKSLQAVNEQRLDLAANVIRSEINRQDHLPFVLSLDSDVRDVLLEADERVRRQRVERLNRKLAHLAQEADTRSMLVMDRDGTIVAAADRDAPGSPVGRSVADQPYFIEAKASGKSSYLSVDGATKRVRYFLAEAVRDGPLLGVAAVRIEFDALEETWAKAGEHVLVTDSDGVVFLASHPVYKYQLIGALGSGSNPQGALSDRYPGLVVGPIDATVLERRSSELLVRIRSPDGYGTYLSQQTTLPEYGWTVYRLTNVAAAVQDQRDGAVIGGSISALIIFLCLYVIQRHRAVVLARMSSAELQQQVAGRTRQLSELNASLTSEIEEHRRTEARLRTMQNELVQAGKLAALGQMSAAIAHEINQPLAAIRTFMASTKIFVERGERDQVLRNLGLIGDLAERMASITAHLKTFARKSDPGHPEPVSVKRAIDRALFLLEGQIKAAGVRVERDIGPDVWVKGYAVQLEQVIINLVVNALDAAIGSAHSAWIRISVHASEDIVSIVFADNGQGIPLDKVDMIFDPFFTTKPVGKGLGLGLSISYGIVQEFGGRIHARNRPEGGAELTVELPRDVLPATPAEVAIHA